MHGAIWAPLIYRNFVLEILKDINFVKFLWGPLVFRNRTIFQYRIGNQSFVFVVDVIPTITMRIGIGMERRTIEVQMGDMIIYTGSGPSVAEVTTLLLVCGVVLLRIVMLSNVSNPRPSVQDRLI